MIIPVHQYLLVKALLPIMIEAPPSLCQHKPPTPTSGTGDQTVRTPCSSTLISPLLSSLRPSRDNHHHHTGCQVPTRFTQGPEGHSSIHSAGHVGHASHPCVHEDLHHTLAPYVSKPHGRFRATFSQHLSRTHP